MANRYDVRSAVLLLLLWALGLALAGEASARVEATSAALARRSGGSGASAMERVLQYDWAVERWINSHHHPAADWALLVMSSPGEMGAIWVLAGIGLIAFGRGRARRTGVLLLAAMLVADGMIGGALRDAFPRVRPYLADPTIRRMGLRWAGGSFPSGHAHSVVIATILLGGEYRRLLPALCLFCLATLYSRPYLGMHFPSDVVVGVAIGLTVGFAARWVGLRWHGRAERRTGGPGEGPPGPQPRRPGERRNLLLLALARRCALHAWGNCAQTVPGGVP